MQGLRHEALLYSDEDSFLAGTLPFIRDAVAAGEPIMVAVDRRKIELLQSRLNGSGDRVVFADMHAIGRNPAMIIPAWQDFVAEYARDGRQVRGIGEPVWPERSPDELIECQHHESLLNLAFASGPAWRLLCPYDTSTLGPDALEAATHSHPLIAERGSLRPSPAYREPEAMRVPFEGPLPDPPGTPDQLRFDSPADLEAVRRFVADRASEQVGPERADGLVLAVDEIVTNTLRHGGGGGTLRAWIDDEAICCEVSDAATITDPLVGRVRPPLDQAMGRGLWIANNFCDLVQIRSSGAGTVVRCRLSRTANPIPA